MTITVNGQSIEPEGSPSLAELIRSVVKDCSKVIAEHNGNIIKKDQWDTIAIQDGDKVELVSFVGGG